MHIMYTILVKFNASDYHDYAYTVFREIFVCGIVLCEILIQLNFRGRW